MGNSSLEMIHLNSSGETVPPSPHGQPGTPSQQQDVLPLGAASQPGQPEGPTAAASKGPLTSPGAVATQPERKATPSVQKATQDLKDKVAQERKKQNAKAADQITFEILADTVAKEIAVMLRATVDRNKSKGKKA